MEPSTSPTIAKKKNHTVFTIVAWVSFVLLVCIVVVAAYLIATKQLIFAINGHAEQGVTVQSRACGTDTIKKYNSAYTATSAESYSAALKTAFTAATAEKHYETDPNCVFIRYSYYVSQKDATQAQKELDSLKTLAGNGSYATSEVVGVQAIDLMQSSVDLLKSPIQSVPTNEQSSGGQG